jgi:hypothetical protein
MGDIKNQAVEDMQAAIQAADTKYAKTYDHIAHAEMIAELMQGKGWTTVMATNVHDTARGLGFVVVGEIIYDERS